MRENPEIIDCPDHPHHVTDARVAATAKRGDRRSLFQRCRWTALRLSRTPSRAPVVVCVSVDTTAYGPGRRATMPSSSHIPTLPTVARAGPKADDVPPLRPSELATSPVKTTTTITTTSTSTGSSASSSSTTASASLKPPGAAGLPPAPAGNPFSRFMSKIEFKSPAFDFGRHKPDGKKRGFLTLTGRWSSGLEDWLIAPLKGPPVCSPQCPFTTYL